MVRLALSSAVGRGAQLCAADPLPHHNLAVNPCGVGLAALTARTVVGRRLAVPAGAGPPEGVGAIAADVRRWGGLCGNRPRSARHGGPGRAGRARGAGGGRFALLLGPPAGGAGVRPHRARQRPTEPIDSGEPVCPSLGGGPAALH